MKPTIQVFDDFMANPDVIREAALALDFKPQEHDGHVYEGVGIGYVEGIQEAIEHAVGCAIKINLQFFRLGMTGIKMQGFIHADANCGQHAGVLYLNLPHQKLGGTSFWRHKATELTEFPWPISEEDALKFRADGDYEFLWERTGHVEMAYNRFVTYPSQLFHSRYPNQVEADTKENGRLVLCIMFDKIP